MDGAPLRGVLREGRVRANITAAQIEPGQRHTQDGYQLPSIPRYDGATDIGCSEAEIVPIAADAFPDPVQASMHLR